MPWWNVPASGRLASTRGPNAEVMQVGLTGGGNDRIAGGAAATKPASANAAGLIARARRRNVGLHPDRN
jgi:hypothetical protein